MPFRYAIYGGEALNNSDVYFYPYVQYVNENLDLSEIRRLHIFKYPKRLDVRI